MEVSHENPQSRQAAQSLVFASGLTFGYFIIELAGGFMTGSLALVADASHMAGDFLSLLFAWFASVLARRSTNLIKTYGYHRVEVLAGLVNAMGLWVVSGMILMNAFKRLANPPPVEAGPMMLIAFFGLAVNIACALLLKKDSQKNLNVRGAYIHVLSDLLGSIGALVGAAVMKWTGNYLADPIVSGFVCLLIIASSLKLMLNSLNILLEGVPPHLDIEAIRRELRAIDGVHDIHDLHVWSLGAGMDMLSGRLVLESGAAAKSFGILDAAGRRMQERFGISHATLQPEIVKSKN
ncbi:MAG: cation transporter [Elusimicrobia bacterium]|nr:cation transporter [Elusimicrobiota bacterium]